LAEADSPVAALPWPWKEGGCMNGKYTLAEETKTVSGLALQSYQSPEGL
jgi:hypothetical protein